MAAKKGGIWLQWDKWWLDCLIDPHIFFTVKKAEYVGWKTLADLPFDFQLAALDVNFDVSTKSAMYIPIYRSEEKHDHEQSESTARQLSGL